jgi:hypothetical protein
MGVTGGSAPSEEDLSGLVRGRIAALAGVGDDIADFPCVTSRGSGQSSSATPLQFEQGGNDRSGGFESGGRAPG